MLYFAYNRPRTCHVRQYVERAPMSSFERTRTLQTCTLRYLKVGECPSSQVSGVALVKISCEVVTCRHPPPPLFAMYTLELPPELVLPTFSRILERASLARLSRTCHYFVFPLLYTLITFELTPAVTGSYELYSQMSNGSFYLDRALVKAQSGGWS